MLNTAIYCAPVSIVSAGQHRSGQVAGVRDTVYGSAARVTERRSALC